MAVSCEACQHAFQFHPFSRLGPCDHFEITNGSYDADGTYVPTGDATAFRRTFTGTEAGALTLLLPGHRFAWKAVVARCPDDLRPDYRADVSPFGARAVAAEAEGFGVDVGATVDEITVLRAVDRLPPGTAAYVWRFRHLESGREWTEQGAKVFAERLYEDGPVSLEVTRTAGGRTNVVRHLSLGGSLARPRVVDGGW